MSSSSSFRLESNRYEVAGVVGDAVNFTETTVSVSGHFMGTANQVAGAAGAMGSLATFALFAPVISDVLKVVKQIVDLYQTAEHNKRICGVLLERVTAAKAAIETLEIRKNEHADFFNDNKNYRICLKLKDTIEKIKRFAEDISQIKGLRKYTIGVLQSKEIRRTFEELTQEFDGHMNSLKFTITIDTRTQQLKDREVFEQDMAELKDYLENIKGGIATMNGGISELIEVVNTLSTHFQKQQQQNQSSTSGSQLSNVVEDKPLNLSEFSLPEEVIRKVHRRTRTVDHVSMAFKEVQLIENMKNNIGTQVAILKKLETCPNIIKFYGYTQENQKTYLVTEWAELGNLQQYYTTRKPIHWERKLELAMDICRGLTMLRAVNILHHDIRSGNILISGRNHQAKIANFGLSRGFNDATKNIGANVDNARYMAPEKLLEKKHRYDYKCEIYSFGMLLWEIAEEELPHCLVKKDIAKIRDIVCEKKHKESFTCPDIPYEYKKIVWNAIEHEPSNRPSISDISKALFPLQRNSNQEPGAGEDSEFAIEVPKMSLDEAIKEHKKEGGDKRKAWDCFNQFKDFGNPLATFWVGYYLYYNVLGWKEDKRGKEKRLKDSVKLFKEAADSGNISDAQLRYAHCLWQGDGIEKNVSEAVKYFKLSADNGNPTAMRNVGIAYLNGIGTEKNEINGAWYLKLAAYNGNDSAAKMCREKGIEL